MKKQNSQYNSGINLKNYVLLLVLIAGFTRSAAQSINRVYNYYSNEFGSISSHSSGFFWTSTVLRPEKQDSSFLHSYNKQGVLKWKRFISKDEKTSVLSLITASDGSAVFLSSATACNGKLWAKAPVYVTKIDSSGNTVFDKKVGMNFFLAPASVKEASNGSYFAMFEDTTYANGLAHIAKNGQWSTTVSQPSTVQYVERFLPLSNNKILYQIFGGGVLLGDTLGVIQKTLDLWVVADAALTTQGILFLNTGQSIVKYTQDLDSISSFQLNDYCHLFDLRNDTIYMCTNTFGNYGLVTMDTVFNVLSQNDINFSLLPKALAGIGGKRMIVAGEYDKSLTSSSFFSITDTGGKIFSKTELALTRAQMIDGFVAKSEIGIVSPVSLNYNLELKNLGTDTIRNFYISTRSVNQETCGSTSFLKYFSGYSVPPNTSFTINTGYFKELISSVINLDSTFASLTLFYFIAGAPNGNIEDKLDNNYLPAQNAKVQIVTSVGEHSIMQSGLQVFPNPCRDEIKVHQIGNFSWEILDLNARVLSSGSGENETLIETPFPRGIYVLRIKTKNGVQQKKLIHE